MSEAVNRTRRGKARARNDADVATTPLAGPLRGRIPALVPIQAQALRGFFASQNSWLLADNGLVHFMPGRTPTEGEFFQIDAEGAVLALRLQATDAVTAPGLHWSDYQGRSRILAWSLAHEQALMRLSEALGVALVPRLTPADPDQFAAGSPLWLDFVIDNDHGDDEDAARRPPAVHGSVRLPAAWLGRVLTRAEPPFDGELPPPLGRWAELPADVSLRMSCPPLPGPDWAALRPGDVVVLGRRSLPPPVQAQAAGQLWPLDSTPQGWRINGPAQPLPATGPRSEEQPQEISQMSENETPPQSSEGEEQATDPDAATRALPVQVAFEIGRMQLRLGELSSLQPGYVFAIPAQLEGANVTILANGQAVGQGELVSVGDTLGVRLLAWD